jgi:DNA-binding transcriptional regulator YdaS (Cro superfamily)
MNLTTYLEESGTANGLAKAVGVSPVVISLWKNGKRPVPIGRCPAIEQATNGAVTRKDLRPNDWARIWPELVHQGQPAAALRKVAERKAVA